VKKRSRRVEKDNKVMLSMKDLKKRPVKKLKEKYVKPYEVEEVMLKSVAKLRLPASMRIYLVVNVSRIKML